MTRPGRCGEKWRSWRPKLSECPVQGSARGTSYVTQLTSEQLITGRYRCWQEWFDRMESRVPLRTCEHISLLPPPCIFSSPPARYPVSYPPLWGLTLALFLPCVQLKRRKGNVIASHDTPPLIRVYTLPYFGGIDTSYASVS